jgi:hypothetical protein
VDILTRLGSISAKDSKVVIGSSGTANNNNNNVNYARKPALIGLY